MPGCLTRVSKQIIARERAASQELRVRGYIVFAVHRNPGRHQGHVYQPEDDAATTSVAGDSHACDDP